MESCRKIVGRGQVANLIKRVQLFELRCLTAYEYALISLQPCNPIHIMLCLKQRLLRPTLMAAQAERFPVKAVRCPGQWDSRASPLLGRVAGFSPCVDILYMFIAMPGWHRLLTMVLHSWLMFYSPPLSLWSHLFKWPKSSLDGAWNWEEGLSYFGNIIVIIIIIITKNLK